MPQSIPYHPSLVLANVVPAKTLATLEEISNLQVPVDAAEDNYNAELLNEQSLEMTTAELANLNIPTEDVAKVRDSVKDAVKQAAIDLANARVTGATAIAAKTKELSGVVTESIESPVDYNKTVVKNMPLSFDSMKFNAQYFSFDGEDQSASSSIMSIKSFVSSSVKVLGDKYAGEATAAVDKHVSSQVENHSIEGTLIITATCTHQDARILAPFVIDVDKGIRVWNQHFAGADDKIDMNNSASVAKIAENEDKPDTPSMSILSGCSMGSSFIGMVHVLRKEGTTSSQTMSSVAATLQGQMEVGGWFADVEGGFGVDSQFANDAKKMLSTQNIQSHISMVVMGVIPSVKSNEVQIGVKQLADFDPAKMMGQLAILANSTGGEQKSTQSSAASARSGGQMKALEASKITAVMSGLEKVDDGKNQMLDINSLMTAMEDYITKAMAGDVGVPLSYYLKPITASQLAQMWISKYLPGEYVTSAGDDTGTTDDPNKQS